MGRNAIPKLNEWCDGKLYRFRANADFGEKIDGPPTPEDGRQIVYEVQCGKNGPTSVLGVAYADGFEEVMAAMWADGYARGKRDGSNERAAEIRRVIGASGDAK